MSSYEIYRIHIMQWLILIQVISNKDKCRWFIMIFIEIAVLSDIDVFVYFIVNIKAVKP